MFSVWGMSKSTTSPNSVAAHQCAVVAPTFPAPMIVIFARFIADSREKELGYSLAITCRKNSWSACRKCHNNRHAPIMPSARRPPTAVPLELLFSAAAGFQSGAGPIIRGAVCNARDEPGLAALSAAESAVGYCQFLKKNPVTSTLSPYNEGPESGMPSVNSRVQNTRGLFCDPSVT